VFRHASGLIYVIRPENLRAMNDVFALEHEIDAQSRTRDRAIAAIAARQHGVVAHRQLTALGLASSSIPLQA
jgi:hypothetical protein